MIGINLCVSCTHKDRLSPMGAQGSCTAFPTGIPPEILGGADHRQPRTGDKGVTWQLLEDMDPEYDLWLSEQQQEELEDGVEQV